MRSRAALYVCGMVLLLSSLGFAGAETTPSLYDSLGLKKGDVLMEVNGISMTSPESALEAMGTLKSAKKLKLKIKRAGKIQLIEREVSEPKQEDAK